MAIGVLSVTGIVHRSDISMHIPGQIWWGCIRPAAPTQLGLAPHLPLAKTPADP
jgi:hypothetical protein